MKFESMNSVLNDTNPIHNFIIKKYYKKKNNLYN